MYYLLLEQNDSKLAIKLQFNQSDFWNEVPMSSTRSLSSSSDNSPPSSRGFFSSRHHPNYTHPRHPHGFTTDSNYFEDNRSFNSSDENDHLPEGFLPVTMFYAREGLETVCFQLTNWYTRISLLIGYLMILLLTLLFLTIAGYFDLNTWVSPFGKENK